MSVSASNHTAKSVTIAEGNENENVFSNRTTMRMTEDNMSMEEAAEVYDAFDRSRLKSKASSSKFNHLDVSLAKSMRDVEER